MLHAIIIFTAANTNGSKALTDMVLGALVVKKYISPMWVSKNTKYRI